MQPGRVTVTLYPNESVIVIKDVPASVCQNCGEYTLNDTVIAEVLKLAEPAVDNNAEIEVFQYAT